MLNWAGADFGLPPLLPAVAPETMLANMRSAMSRGLPLVKLCRPHGHVLSIAGGGPSLADTHRELTGYVAAINGSLHWLLYNSKIIGPLFCGIMDAGPHIADMIEVDRNVRYYVASICDPSVFDKLKGCEVVLWHVTPNSTEAPEEVAELIGSSISIGGGCTMGLRWLNLGYVLGFRTFNCHGLDSSFRDGNTHAYPDRADDKERIMVRGRQTRPNFLAQVADFFPVMDALKREGRVEIKLFGDGLLQDEYRRRRGC